MEIRHEQLVSSYMLHCQLKPYQPVIHILGAIFKASSSIATMLSWLKAIIRNYFGFSKAETHGVLLLIGLMIICLMLPQMLARYYSTRYTVNHQQDIALLDSMLVLLEQQSIAQQMLTGQPHKHGIYASQPDSSQKKYLTTPNIQVIDINMADTSQLQQLKGIGMVLSARIIKYRDQLGGFISQDQYQEIYGLKPVVIQRLVKQTYITPDYQPKRININTASFKMLVAHPYLTYDQVQRIMRHRAEHGRFSVLEELLMLKILEADVFKRVKPYLAIY